MRGLLPSIIHNQIGAEEVLQTPMKENCNVHTQGYKRSTKEGLYIQTDTVNRCLTDDCNDCTGFYRNDLLQHRIICHCECHSEEEEEQALALVEPRANATGNGLPFQDGTQND